MSTGVIIQEVTEEKQPPNGVRLISILFCMSAAGSEIVWKPIHKLKY